MQRLTEAQKVELRKRKLEMQNATDVYWRTEVPVAVSMWYYGAECDPGPMQKAKAFYNAPPREHTWEECNARLETFNEFFGKLG